MSMQNESKTRSPLLLLLVLTALLITAPLAVSQDDASPEKELLQLANQARAAQNLPPLKWDSALAHAARVPPRMGPSATPASSSINTPANPTSPPAAPTQAPTSAPSQKTSPPTEKTPQNFSRPG